ncbi:enolase, putative [Trichomonas vaginalis G3]|uniref:phosphopyruvate hydratase n=1 Tax=Trichomonas vaginalis (strain ATCC PRA-98 / G3) TaxID=412133 RepID=A2E9S4_TRIV3|nr:enolase family [Trichomonas vaginalis G3]EAY10609.1 enolase, putative [Trichomonas vaginalis G3]KAI5540861.1 enolase family [Trichomonas vaginalis G3]|eukprot:XP_001322832.1 enolase [Trichomonas vaginalis G3]
MEATAEVTEEPQGDTPEIVEAKRKYLVDYDIQNVLHEALNELMESRPEDVFGVLSRIFERRAAKPIIDHVLAREVLDSRGNPTVEVDVYAKYLNTVEFVARSSSPSGASTGSKEAKELRDGDNRFGGKGVTHAVKNVNTIISKAIAGKLLENLAEIDNAIIAADGTELKEKLGGNATTATSFAVATAGAAIRHEELFIYLARQFHEEMPKKFKLPALFFNILNGGKHAGGNLKIQEFMISPRTDISFPEQLRMIGEIYQKLGQVVVKKYGVSAKNLGDEGGYAPALNTPEEALEVIERAANLCGYQPGSDVFFALDAAASEFYDATKKQYEILPNVWKTGDEMIEFWKDLIAKHPAIISIEDGLEEKDYETWIKLNEQLGSKIQLVGDDLYTTNPKMIEQGIEKKWCNALLMKVNQIGTITEAMKAAKLVLSAGQKVMVSHRSGETCNSLISDLAVAIGAQSIKAGSCARGERIQKYTRLLQIYEYLRDNNML